MQRASPRLGSSYSGHALCTWGLPRLVKGRGGWGGDNGKGWMVCTFVERIMRLVDAVELLFFWFLLLLWVN
jgi:hypothetical protein